MQSHVQRGRVIERWANTLLQVEGPPPADTVTVNLIHRILRGAVDLGASRPALLAALGVDDALLRHPLARLPGDVLVRLLALIDKALADPVAVLKVAFAVRPTCFSDIGFISRYARDLGAVLETNVRNQVLRQNMFLASFDPAGNPPALRWAVDPARAEEFGSAMELSVGTYIRLCREILGSVPHLDQVLFQHRPRFATQLYEDMFQCPVRFSTDQTAIELQLSALYYPAPNANVELMAQGIRNYNKSAQWMSEGLECSANGYFYLSTELNKSPLKLPRMAAALGLSERTLRRRLEEEGHPFRALLDEVRKDMCSLYRMEGTRSLGEVALLLGYAELSAFTRAYRRWYGEPPSVRWAV